jgi:RNA exonuclease 4
MVQCEEKFSCLARVSIVNYYGHVLIDSFIRPTKKITNYLTWVSGVTYQHIKDAPTLEEILP